MKKILLLIMTIFASCLQICLATGNDVNPSVGNCHGSNGSVVGMSDGVSVAYPVDLLPEGTSVLGISNTMASANVGLLSSKESHPLQVSNESRVTVNISTNDFGQLETLLEEKDAANANQIVISGPIDETDFKSLWHCAVKGNLRILDLKAAKIKNDEVPDRALYDPVQYDAGYWLKIQKIVLPDDIVKIGKAAFAFMELEEINIPSSLKELGSTVFGYDYWLNCPIVIPEGVEEIKYQTFIDCSSLSISPVLPSTLKKIGSSAFSNTPFQRIEFKDGLEFIGQGAFQSCGLTEVIIPNSIIEIEPMAFQLSDKIAHVSLPGTMEEFPAGIFSFCYGLESIIIPEGIKNIKDSAFMCCENLKDIVFPKSLETIEEDAFDGCNVGTIVLHPNVKFLGSYCFLINVLKTVYCSAEIPPVCATDPFAPFAEGWLNRNDAVLYVPIGCKEKYQEKWGWSMFKNIIETDEFPSAGVAEVCVDKAGDDGSLYDLQGRKVAQPAKGRLYIRNGKAIIYQ